MLREIPAYERPREKAIKYGIESLSNIELMAIILRTGSKDANVMDLSKNLLYSIDSLTSLKSISILELTNIKGIGTTKAITILATIEIAKRLIEEKNEVIQYTTPLQVYSHFYDRFKGATKEYFYAIYLNTKGCLIKEKLITTGTLTSSLVDEKDIFKWAFKLTAASIILVHNHPSGDPTPSLADMKATSDLIKQAKQLGIIIVDHVIIGESYYSMKENCKYCTMFK